MMLLATREIITRKHFVLDPAISRALAHDDRDIIVNYLTFKQFKDRDMIYCPYLLERRKWVVIIVNIVEKTVTGYNTQLLECSEVLRNICENIAKNIDILLWATEKIKFVEPTPLRLINSNVGESGPLVYGYIRNTVTGFRLTMINTKKIKDRARQLILANKREYKSGLGPMVKANIKPMNTINLRQAMSYTILEQIKTKPLDDMQDALIKLIMEIRPIKPDRKLFVGGNKSDRGTSDTKLRRVYNIMPASAVGTIVNDTVADCWPDEEDMREHYSNKQLSIPILNDCIGNCVTPCKRGCVLFDYLKCGREEFDFTLPTTSELTDVVTRKKPTAPGRNGITYRDIIYADPDMMVSHRIVEECFTRKVIPSSWRSYNTVMIPKPMKQGHYHEVGSWRPIALLDSSYKIYTTALCQQLKHWCDSNQLLHPMQKSLGLFDGCAEHNFLLRALLEQ